MEAYAALLRLEMAADLPADAGRAGALAAGFGDADA